MMPYRVGVQTEDPECASVKVIPCDANRSAFGVGIFEVFGARHWISPYPRSSHRMKTIFGRLVAALAMAVTKRRRIAIFFMR
jgi:hypothetical protein